MTINEKFEEVFGVKLEECLDLCSIADCDDIPCSLCPLYGNSNEFNQYREPKKVITCKDCTKGQREYTDSKKYCMWLGRITEDDFYCADAERRE